MIRGAVGDFCQKTVEVLEIRAGGALAQDGVWLAMKGKHPADELAAMPAGIEVFHVEQLQVPGLDAQRCLVWMRPRAAH